MSMEEKIKLIGKMIRSDTTTVDDISDIKSNKTPVDKRELDRLAKELKPLFSRYHHES